ncbi:copper amine oxidase N-terminal domain-containing protein [Paenibacillus sp. NPDC057967]|uniref:copper amine oxidase N-terminal domain-containing protein n=1 Tax=Paenibacillus sp. NPDC057967 TaxID=3346293 RepID=UPI0036DA237A
MKNKYFALLSLIIALVVASIPTGAWAASEPASKPAQIKTQPINLIFDGQELKLPDGQYSFIYQGRTYIPIRYISYALLKTVGWNAEQFMVSINDPNTQELAELKKELLLVTGGTKKPHESIALSMKQANAKLVFNGKEKSLPKGQSIFIYKGSIYVPLRFLSESVGSEITWDDKTRTVTSESKAYREGESGETKPGDNGSVEVPPSVPPGEEVPKQTYEQITANAESKLVVLRDSCKTELINLALEYFSADDDAQKQIKTKISQKVNSCTSKFEALVSDTTSKLEANGYSTDIIAQYRNEFEAELEAGKKILEQMS